MEIKEIIARRTDLSTFLVHLARDLDGISAPDRLRQILVQWRLTARTPYGSAVQRLTEVGENTASQRSVCFTETPLEHVYWLLQPVQGRQIEFRPYGVALPKKQGRALGINPVWYLDMTPGHDWLTAPLNQLIEEAVTSGHFATSPVARLTPFIEQMGTWQDVRKEFWWEREWRCRGDLGLPSKLIVLCPEAEFANFEQLVTEHHVGRSPIFIDPRWGLEQIIGRLAGYASGELEML